MPKQNQITMSNTAQQGYEEIDLIELIIKIYKFFKRRIKLIIILVVVFAGLGLVASFFILKPRYQSTMIISSRSLTASEVAGLIEAIDNLAFEDNSKEIEKLTNIPAKNARKIQKIKVDPTDSTAITIKIELTDNENWDIYQKGIVNYLENQPYVKKKTALYKESQEKLLRDVQKEIKHLDSLKKIIEASSSGKTQFILSNSSQVYSEILKLYDSENQIRANLAFVDDIQVIKGFTNYKKPKKLSPYNTISLFAVVGLIIGVVVSLTIELNKAIRKREGKE